MKVTELIEGKGATAKKNSQIKVRFSYRIDGSKDEMATDSEFEFTLGSKNVIQGWNIGLLGAKKGSQRIVYCPPEVAYGELGFPPLIPPNSTLIYTFEVLSIGAKKEVIFLVRITYNFPKILPSHLFPPVCSNLLFRN